MLPTGRLRFILTIIIEKSVCNDVLRMKVKYWWLLNEMGINVKED